MTFKLPPLPYETDALSPYLSKETVEYHYGKHHKAYVTKLNNGLEENDKFMGSDLETIIREADGSLFNNAAQVWNHTFYWNCLTPRGEKKPKGAMDRVLQEYFETSEKFQEIFTKKAASLFGSGWIWLVKNEDGSLTVEQTKDADNPLTKKQTPLLTCDVWEHAYYIDYRNERPKYLDAFWKLINWEFVESQLQGVREAVTVSHGG